MYRENNHHLFRRRILVNICLAAAAFCFPWWFSLPLAVVVFFFFNEFIELVIVGLIIDTLHAPHTFFTLSSYRYFLTSLVLFILLSLVRRQLR